MRRNSFWKVVVLLIVLSALFKPAFIVPHIHFTFVRIPIGTLIGLYFLWKYAFRDRYSRYRDGYRNYNYRDDYRDNYNYNNYNDFDNRNYQSRYEDQQVVHNDYNRDVNNR